MSCDDGTDAAHTLSFPARSLRNEREQLRTRHSRVCDGAQRCCCQDTESSRGSLRTTPSARAGGADASIAFGQQHRATLDQGEYRFCVASRLLLCTVAFTLGSCGEDSQHRRCKLRLCFHGQVYTSHVLAGRVLPFAVFQLVASLTGLVFVEQARPLSDAAQWNLCVG